MLSSLSGPPPPWVPPQALSSMVLPERTGCNSGLLIIPTTLGCWCRSQAGRGQLWFPCRGAAVGWDGNFKRSFCWADWSHWHQSPRLLITGSCGSGGRLSLGIFELITSLSAVALKAHTPPPRELWAMTHLHRKKNSAQLWETVGGYVAHHPASVLASVLSGFQIKSRLH